MESIMSNTLRMNAVSGVEIEISVVLGKATLQMAQLLKMGRGAVIELDTNQNDEVWILANDKPIARGEIMIQGDRIAVSITDDADIDEYDK